MKILNSIFAYRLKLIAISGLITILAACGGGGSSSADNSGALANGEVSSEFFDSIFMKESGSGYYTFEAYDPGFASGKMEGRYADRVTTARTQSFVESGSDSILKQSTSTVAGNYFRQLANYIYITSDGAFIAQDLIHAGVGGTSKIFQKYADGFDVGTDDMSTPLYRSKLRPRDISGQSVKSLAILDPRLAYIFENDESAAPTGAKSYNPIYTALKAHILVDSPGSSNTWLEAEQAKSGGTIETLGGYRYLKYSSGNRVTLEFNGLVFSGNLYAEGAMLSFSAPGYNRTAADFIAQREVAVLGR
jgi:hypothetical protein